MTESTSEPEPNMQTYTLSNGRQVQIEIREHPGGYAIIHSLIDAETVYITCCCESKGCVSTECPTSTFTCDCTGTDPVLTCG